ncbi:MAG: MBL fold metallo-hydrolase [Alysiella sp.]|uniref:MBL fold metallo-hydrolase n=1 Tax=Alysiella sp. TaxID=1872483 RepID=UPI0026DC915B|nr:MBL fold metallo-hydrolase [Alysiella sp.]MDO4433907.1 MBL fold metallo-hydrolase [Alysiella sp.]
MKTTFQTLSNLFHLINPRPRFPTQKRSTHYNPHTQTFFNTPPTQKIKNGTLVALWQMMTRPELHRPTQQLPMIQPDWDTFLAPSNTIKMIWFGHSSLLIRAAGQTLFLDPVYCRSASPLPIMMHRFQPPPVALHNLPHIDWIIHTHAHYDHLDREVIRHFQQHAPQTRYLAPLGMGSYLKYWGISATHIHELDWHQTLNLPNLNIHALPARHDASRSTFDGKKSLWAAYVLQTPHEKIYFSGDSSYASHFADAAKQFGGFDLALIENGQYNENWRDNHMHPEETVQAACDLNCKRWQPIHWGAYPLAPHAWDEPVRRSAILSDAAGLTMLTPLMGQVFDATSPTSRWWENLPQQN